MSQGGIMVTRSEFFNFVMPAGVGSLQELLASEPVSKVECEMIKDGVRETIYMFSCAAPMPYDPGGGNTEAVIYICC